MTIIVTGGAGFIGANFIFHMMKAHPDYRLVCLDKLTYAGNLSTLAPVMDKPNFRFVKADICDRQAVDRLFEEEKPDAVVVGLPLLADGSDSLTTRQIRNFVKKLLHRLPCPDMSRRDMESPHVGPLWQVCR